MNATRTTTVRRTATALALAAITTFTLLAGIGNLADRQYAGEHLAQRGSAPVAQAAAPTVRT